MRRTASLALCIVPVLAPLLSGPLARADEQPPFPPGTLLTVAGNGKAGFSGDGGPATQAKLSFPLDLAFDGAPGDRPPQRAFGAPCLFINDHFNVCIRRVSPDGTITTVAGMAGLEGFSGDGGPATKARLSAPHGLVIDTAGALYFSDARNQRVRKVDPSGANFANGFANLNTFSAAVDDVKAGNNLVREVVGVGVPG